MSQAEILTDGAEQDRLSIGETGRSGGLAHPPCGRQADDVGLSYHERDRLSATLSPQVAVVLPLMLALARLQASHEMTEQVR